MGQSGSRAAAAVDLAATVPALDALPTLAETTTPSGIRVVALRTGWVGVKTTHRELDVPAVLAVPAIMLGGRWAAWMPIVSYLVVHPVDGAMLVDTGPDPAINAPDYFVDDPNNGFFYRRNLRFHVPEGDSLGPRLAQAGVDPAAVRTLLITHFHGDHIGGVGLLPNARAYVGPGNWPNHLGAFTKRLPAGFHPTDADYRAAGPSGAPGTPGTGAGPSEAPGTMGTEAAVFDELFPETHRLTADGTVRIVPLPGHTPGHAGLAVVDGGRVWLMAGDATFDVQQTQRCGVCGISQNVAQALATQARLQALMERAPGTVLLPAHDPDVFQRLAKTGGRAGKLE